MSGDIQQIPLSRIFNDPIHGNIELNKACQLIVDTQEFQRLRDIKQLGVVDFVYPGATHTRFEHALGSCYLAGLYVRKLKDVWNNEYGSGVENNENNITETDILCVEIAALCHDLGVGPFSTLFSIRLLQELDVVDDRMGSKRNASMFQHMLKMNGLKGKTFGLVDDDITFIEELMQGNQTTGEWTQKGRGIKKAFLYEIVQNQRNGIDVCKFDYMARDCQNLGITNNFDAQRYMEFARIIEVEEGGKKVRQICTRDKEKGNLYNLFFTRYNLHKFAYQHPVVLGIEMMITELFVAFKDQKIIKGKEWLSLSNIVCFQDLNSPIDQEDVMRAFTRLTDGVLFAIRNYKEPEDQALQTLEGPSHLLERLFTRDIYKCCAWSPPIKEKTLRDILKSGEQSDEGKSLDTRENRKKIREILVEHGSSKFQENDIRTTITYLDFGMKDVNPIDKLNVYKKNKLDDVGQMERKEISTLLEGMNFSEIIVRVYTTFDVKDKANKDKSKAIKEAFNKIEWSEK